MPRRVSRTYLPVLTRIINLPNCHIVTHICTNPVRLRLAVYVRMSLVVRYIGLTCGRLRSLKVTRVRRVCRVL